MTSEDRLTRLESIVEKLVQVALSSDERMDELKAAQANSDAKIAALTDAQIRTEDGLRQFRASTEAMMAALAESHIRLAESHTRLAEAHARLEESLARLADSQAHTDARLDALIDIVREQREGKRPGSSEEGEKDV